MWSFSPFRSCGETEPVDVVDQPSFVNGACLVETTLTPRALLEALLAIEERLGRVREVRRGPRTIDLDLLLFGSEVLDEPGFTVPTSTPARTSVRTRAPA